MCLVKVSEDKNCDILGLVSKGNMSLEGGFISIKMFPGASPSWKRIQRYLTYQAATHTTREMDETAFTHADML